MRSGDDLDDGALWQLAVDGDGLAFGELFERHADRVYNYCFRRIGSWDAATDSTSMVFLEAWRRRRDVQVSTSSILPWLLVVANNVVRHQRRAQRRHRQALDRLPAAGARTDHADDVAAQVDAERTMRDVRKALAGMPAAEQDVLTLCVWSQVSYKDAAVVLGVPVGTVKSRLSRAKNRLRARSTEISAASTAVKAGESP